jgi:hypothetical protein
VQTRTRADRRARRARVREFRKQVLDSGFTETGFAQANFLLFKQLLYFERYGKLYLADAALMGDRDWLEHVLEITASEQLLDLTVLEGGEDRLGEPAG